MATGSISTEISLRLQLLMILSGALLPVLAHAQEKIPLRLAIEQLQSETSTGCANEQRALEAARANTPAKSLRARERLHEAICTCMPERLATLRKSATEAELARPVGLAEFQRDLEKRVMQPCTGAMFRDLFGGPLCRELMAHATCSCMAPEVARFTDAEAAELGATFSQFKQAEEKARKAGTALPARSALMNRMLTSVEKCKAP
jgi:hypothetical protein